MNKKSDDLESQDLRLEKKGVIYDKGTIKVVVFACLVIMAAVVFTGCVSYFITRTAIVDKLKSRDLIYIVESITSKVEGRIERAKETSLMLASDPSVVQWIAGGEKDEQLGQYAKSKINDIAKNYDYANSFIVSAVTNHYWAEDSKLIQVMSPDDPNAKWFYNALNSGKVVDLNIDYNSGRQDTFVFLNALVGDAGHPLAVAGVGLSLKKIAQEFYRYKDGERSNLWLVDNNGKIHLSDGLEYNGKNLDDYIPSEVFSQVISDKENASSSPKVIEYINTNGEMMDLAYQSMKSTDWKVVFQIPRSESVAFLGSIKFNTMAASIVTLLLMIFIFYVVSRKIADPLKRALLITKEMENQVNVRTRELAEKNQKILDSIDYAKRLQEAILAPADELRAVLGNYFVLWKPRDIVGGDFYWVRRMDSNRSFIALADCTGHGVPGAFMTMAVNATLNYLVDQNYTDPGEMLAELNRRIKQTLHRNDDGRMSDDGLDICICRIDNNKRLLFAGAKIPLYINRENQVATIKADNSSVGYIRSSSNLKFTTHSWDIQPGDRFYLTTDGYIDQNGGKKDYSFGRQRFVQAIIEQGASDISQQSQAFEEVLNVYMGNEVQRDDITLVGFSLR